MGTLAQQGIGDDSPEFNIQGLIEKIVQRQGQAASDKAESRALIRQLSQRESDLAEKLRLVQSGQATQEAIAALSSAISAMLSGLSETLRALANAPTVDVTVTPHIEANLKPCERTFVVTKRDADGRLMEFKEIVFNPNGSLLDGV